MSYQNGYGLKTSHLVHFYQFLTSHKQNVNSTSMMRFKYLHLKVIVQLKFTAVYSFSNLVTSVQIRLNECTYL